MRLLVMLLLLGAGLGAVAQDADFKNTISIAPLRFFADGGNPGVELAWERHYHPRRSLQYVAAYLFPTVQKNRSTLSFNGVRIGVDHRFYIARGANYYIAPGLVFNRVRYQYADQYEHPADQFATDTMHLTRTSVILNVTQGAALALTKHLSVDFAAGIGLKHRHVAQHEKGALVSRTTDWYDFQSLHRPGAMWTVALPAQLRIGYRF